MVVTTIFQTEPQLQWSHSACQSSFRSLNRRSCSSPCPDLLVQGYCYLFWEAGTLPTQFCFGGRTRCLCTSGLCSCLKSQPTLTLVLQNIPGVVVRPGSIEVWLETSSHSSDRVRSGPSLGLPAAGGWSPVVNLPVFPVKSESPNMV